MVEPNLSGMAEIAGVLGHPLRLRIVGELAHQPANVTRLVEVCRTEQATVSKHLKILATSGLLRCTPDGRCRVYALSDEPDTRALLQSLARLAKQAKKRSAGVPARRAS